MDTLTEPLPKKRGPKYKGNSDQFHLWIQTELREWAMHQPEGASALVRKLLEDERQRRMTGAPHEQ